MNMRNIAVRSTSKQKCFLGNLFNMQALSISLFSKCNNPNLSTFNTSLGDRLQEKYGECSFRKYLKILYINAAAELHSILQRKRNQMEIRLQRLIKDKWICFLDEFWKNWSMKEEKSELEIDIDKKNYDNSNYYSKSMIMELVDAAIDGLNTDSIYSDMSFNGLEEFSLHEIETICTEYPDIESISLTMSTLF